MDLNITIAYAPHNGWDKETREEFWEDLHKLEDSKLKTPVTGRIILIDANGEIGRGAKINEKGEKEKNKEEEKEKKEEGVEKEVEIRGRKKKKGKEREEREQRG